MATKKRLSRRNRSRVQQRTQQLPPAVTLVRRGRGRPAEGVRIEMLVELCRALIRNNPNGDTLWLALHHVEAVTGASKSEMALLREAIQQVCQSGVMPAGFYPGL